MKQKKTFGFSLIEIMVVIAIIAIIATLAIPSQAGAITQRRIIESINLIDPYKLQIEAYYRFHAGKFPANNEDAGLPDADKIKGNYLEKMVIRDGAMHLYFGQKMPEKLHHKILSIRPIFVKDSPNSPVSWVCGLNKIPSGMTAAGTDFTDIEPLFLPGRCR